MCIISDPEIIDEIIQEVMRKPSASAIKRNEFASKLLKKARGVQKVEELKEVVDRLDQKMAEYDEFLALHNERMDKIMETIEERMKIIDELMKKYQLISRGSGVE